jgi:hypothetical protein
MLFTAVATRNRSRDRALLDYLSVHFFFKSDDQLLADAKRGSAEVASRSKNQFQNFFFAGFVFLQIQLNDLLAFGDVQFINVTQQFEGFRLLVCFLLRVYLDLGLNAGFRKILLRFSTRLSARSMVTPVDFCHQNSRRESGESEVIMLPTCARLSTFLTTGRRPKKTKRS